MYSGQPGRAGARAHKASDSAIISEVHGAGRHDRRLGHGMSSHGPGLGSVMALFR
jgi:hypothetical protein